MYGGLTQVDRLVVVGRIDRHAKNGLKIVDPDNFPRH